jgi:hypothetical protein
MPPASHIHLFSQTSPCTLLPSAYFPLVCMVCQAMQGSKPKRVHTILCLLSETLHNWFPSWCHDLPTHLLHTDFSLCWLSTLKMEVMHSSEMSVHRLHGVISQKMATLTITHTKIHSAITVSTFGAVPMILISKWFNAIKTMC